MQVDIQAELFSVIYFLFFQYENNKQYNIINECTVYPVKPIQRTDQSNIINECTVYPVKPIQKLIKVTL